MKHEEDRSRCLICKTCGECITCGFCDKFGCGHDIDYDGDYIG